MTAGMRNGSLPQNRRSGNMAEELKVLGYFDPDKAQQAAAVLFQALDCRSMSRMKLLKLLYIADRERVRAYDAGCSLQADPHVCGVAQERAIQRVNEPDPAAGPPAGRWPRRRRRPPAPGSGELHGRPGPACQDSQIDGGR